MQRLLDACGYMFNDAAFRKIDDRNYRGNCIETEIEFSNKNNFKINRKL